MEVLTPTSKTVQYYIGMRLLVYVYREFRANEKPSSVPRVRADELISQFPALTEGFIRKRLKHCADLQVCHMSGRLLLMLLYLLIVSAFLIT